MDAPEPPPLDDGNANDPAPSPRVRDWFWRPARAKVLWALFVLYWTALYGMMLVPPAQLNGLVEGTMLLLIFLFNPVTVIVFLGYGFLKAMVACGDWVITPGMSPEHAEWLRREREAAYLNPADARSSYMHQDYLDGLAPHSNGHVGP